MAGAEAVASLAAVAAGWLDHLDGPTATATLRLRRWWSSGGGRVVAAGPPSRLLGWWWPAAAPWSLRSAWGAARAAAVAPALAAASWACLALSAMLLADAVLLAAASLLAPLRRCRAAGPIAGPGPAPGEDVDEEAGGRGAGYPMVLVQIPMYNEREVRPQPLVYSVQLPQRVILTASFWFGHICRCTSFPSAQRAGWHGRRIGSSYRFSTIPPIQRSR